MSDIKSRLRHVMNLTNDTKTDWNGQNYSLHEMNSKINQYKNILNLNSNFETKSGVNNRLDFSIENFKKARNSSVKREKSSQDIKSFQYSNLNSPQSPNSYFGNKSQTNLSYSGILVNNKADGKSNIKSFAALGTSSAKNSTKELDINKKLNDLFENKKEEKSLDFANFGVRGSKTSNAIIYSSIDNLRNSNSTNTNSLPNKSRDHSVNLSTLGKNNFSSGGGNDRLRKEIENYSKTLIEVNSKKNSSYINRPPVSLNKPELDVNSKEYLEFSPTNTKKNLIVTSNILRHNDSFNINQKSSNYVNFHNSNKNLNRSQSKNHNFLTINAYNNKPKQQSYINVNLFNSNSNKSKQNLSILNLNGKNQTIQNSFKLLFKDQAAIDSTSGSNFFSDKKSSAQTRVNTNANLGLDESVEDFCRELDKKSQRKKGSYMDKYSPPKKKNTFKK